MNFWGGKKEAQKQLDLGDGGDDTCEKKRICHGHPRETLAGGGNPSDKGVKGTIVNWRVLGLQKSVGKKAGDTDCADSTTNQGRKSEHLAGYVNEGKN